MNGAEFISALSSRIGLTQAKFLLQNIQIEVMLSLLIKNGGIKEQEFDELFVQEMTKVIQRIQNQTFPQGKGPETQEL